MGRESREVWAKRVERWTDSGLTAKEFAAEVGINAHSLMWWKWRLGAGATAAASGASRPSSPRRRRRATPRVAPLTFVEMPRAEQAGDSDALEIVLASSVRIRVRPNFDDATLRRLLEVLDRR